jgi:hypothetical protein
VIVRKLGSLFAVTLALLAAGMPAAAAKKTCVLPAVELGRGEHELARHFAAPSRRFVRLRTNVRTAFQRACDNGLIAGANVPKLDNAPLRSLKFENIPDGNAASLLAEQLPGGAGWRLVLQHPFVASDGSVNVPTVAEIEEAIFCTVKGASRKEQEETGRCLVD